MRHWRWILCVCVSQVSSTASSASTDASQHTVYRKYRHAFLVDFLKKELMSWAWTIPFKLGCVMCIDARLGQEWFICDLFVSVEFGEAIITVCTVQKMEVRIADQICLACWVWYINYSLVLCCLCAHTCLHIHPNLTPHSCPIYRRYVCHLLSHCWGTK